MTRKILVLYAAVQILLSLALLACSSAKPVEAEATDYIEAETTDHIEAEATCNEPVEVADNSKKRIICWGDSLTEGTGGEGVTIPNVLADLSGCEVFNYGVYSENSSLIAARQGGKPSHVENIDEIPDSVTPVKVNIVDDDGTWELWCNFGDAGINPCRIAGVEGTLSIDPSDGSRYFTRLEQGDAVHVKDGERFYTHAMMDAKPDDILVIWSGSSDRWNEEPSIDVIVENIDSMLKFSNCDEYVIIGYTVWDGFIDNSVPKMWNERLKEEYGEHFLNIKEYLIQYGLDDAGIVPTEQDKIDIENGEVPGSLLSDDSHGNAAFYTIIGKQVYRKMAELGYID